MSSLGRSTVIKFLRRRNVFWTNYEVHEHQKSRTYCISFRRDPCEFTCSCHLLEFRGIICWHAITVMVRNCITEMPDRYILRRWRRDVKRAHMRVKVNYVRLGSIPGQVRYDNMCEAFSKLADLVADDEE
ncbi:FAR1-RELATED SEQUENCE 5-like [Olea europaea subsp. europaea]|uniref:Protein FAR1-RELATED SEQUENCE n=1 Tax=Olea europaea subsp. europaea TaxID=158383 RepID=A0A8S0UAQ7_OLEEU|nr:FAR1-RELATED SEQUENCE 5-like [Olea europaea subsp. europaea]